jgi:hypothetical protein
MGRFPVTLYKEQWLRILGSTGTSAACIGAAAKNVNGVSANSRVDRNGIGSPTTMLIEDMFNRVKQPTPM